MHEIAERREEPSALRAVELLAVRDVDADLIVHPAHARGEVVNVAPGVEEVAGADRDLAGEVLRGASEERLRDDVCRPRRSTC